MGERPLTDGCIPDEVLAARASGELDGARVHETDAHLATCESCRVVLSELVRSDSERPHAPSAGRYVLEEIIGAGGMGTVWSAWDPKLNRRVAVKVLRELPADREHRAQRFLAERQILGGLEHPNIARLLDGGETADGRSYFVMELVDGLRIDAYCERKRLTARQKLDLMRPVCAAVSYAHRHLVVHRDLKPSNILVTFDGVPKLVDFGIAKLLLDQTTLTQTGMTPMTPAFAAPEQVRREPSTTASDVYALGVLLYELLTAKSPYPAPREDLEAVLHAVLHHEPRPPSRALDDPKLARELEGDVDAIVLMALRKDANDRYPSAQALGDDLAAALEGLPTAARRGERVYQALKVLRRYRTAAIAATAVFLALCAGLVATAYQAGVAQRERALAERRFAEVRTLAHAVLFDYHDSIAELEGSTPVRERLVTDALRYLGSLAADARGDIALQNELSAAYLKIGDVQGDPFTGSLGHSADARKSYLEARAIAAAVLAAEPANAAALRNLAVSHEKIGALLEVTGELVEAVAEYQRARALYAKLLERDPGDVGTRFAMSSQDIASGQVSYQRGQLDDAQLQLERALAEREAVVKVSPETAHRRGVSVAHHSLGMVLYERLDAAGSDRHFLASEKILEGLVAENPTSARFERELSTVRMGHADMLIGSGRAAEALAMLQRIVAVGEQQLAADPDNAVTQRDVFAGLAMSASALHALGRPAEELAPLERALALNTALRKSDPDNVQTRRDGIHSLLGLALAQLQLGDAVVAEKRCRDALELAQKIEAEASEDLENLADGHACLAEVYAERRPADALPETIAAIDTLNEVLKKSPAHRLTARLGEAWLLRGEILSRLAAKAGAEAARAHWVEARHAFEQAVTLYSGLKAQNALVGRSVAALERSTAGNAKAAAALAVE